MAETVERQQLEALWGAELRRIGRDAVIAELGSTPANPGVTFPLYLPDGKRDPKRGYVEEWLGRMEDEAKATAAATEEKRFRYILVAAVLAVVVGIMAAWPPIGDWIK
jgi:hypothetical protein